jgi:hypothetical protein
MKPMISSSKWGIWLSTSLLNPNAPFWSKESREKLIFFWEGEANNGFHPYLFGSRTRASAGARSLGGCAKSLVYPL